VVLGPGADGALSWWFGFRAGQFFGVVCLEGDESGRKICWPPGVHRIFVSTSVCLD
jgi:hypothetical protein